MRFLIDFSCAGLGFCLAMVLLYCLPLTTYSQQRNTQDTTRNDSIPPKRKVKPKAVQVRHDLFKRGKPYLDSIVLSFNKFHYWDETDTLAGFVTSLGQIGKPYRQYQYGIAQYYLPSLQYRDPVFAEPNSYFWNPAEQMPFFDTRTPYIVTEFNQSANETQIFSIQFSQNIRPLWNATVRYRRRSSIGAYPNFITDHYNFLFSNYFHSYNKRFHLFNSFSYNQLNDALNGGTFQDGSVPFELSFDKSGARTQFSSNTPRTTRKLRALYSYSEYRLGSDSSLLGLTGIAGLELKEYLFIYKDPILYDSSITAAILKNEFYPYGQMYVKDTAINTDPSGKSSFIPLTSTLFESRKINTFSIGDAVLVHSLHPFAGLRGKIQLKPFLLQTQYVLHFEQHRLQAYGNTNFPFANATIQNKQTQISHSILDINKLNIKVENEMRFAFNNLLPAEFYFDIKAKYEPFIKNIVINDSSVIDTSRKRQSIRKPFIYSSQYVPYSLNFEYILNNQNPNLFQTYWQGTTFNGIPNLDNELITFLHASADMVAKPRIKLALPYRPNMLQLGVFWSQINRVINYDSLGQVFQAAFNNPYRVLGLELKGRIGIKRFYLEGQGVAQSIKTSGELLKRMQSLLPQYWGKISFIYENKIKKTGLTLFISIDLWGFSAFKGYQLEPSTQIFYPQSSYALPSYMRVDVTAAGKIGSKVYAYIKFIHANEGLMNLGYYTTPYYPMLGRTMCFGVNWTLFD